MPHDSVLLTKERQEEAWVKFTTDFLDWISTCIRFLRELPTYSFTNVNTVFSLREKCCIKGWMGVVIQIRLTDPHVPPSDDHRSKKRAWKNILRLIKFPLITPRSINNRKKQKKIKNPNCRCRQSIWLIPVWLRI